MRDNRFENRQFRVLPLLEGALEVTQRQIAKQLGGSPEGINYCLRAFVDKEFMCITLNLS